MRGLNEDNSSGRLTERLIVVVDLVIDDDGIVRNYFFGALNRGVCSVKCGYPRIWLSSSSGNSG